MNINYFIFGKSAVPLNGTLVKNLILKDTDHSSGWAIAYDFAAGSTIFGDRTFTCATLPSELSGAEVILTSCDSKFYDGELAEFTAGADITVSAAIDSRVENIPEWLSGWTNSGQSLTTSNDLTMNIYQKNFKSGETVTLGTNGQSSYCVNYTVLVIPEKTTVKGDINQDGSVNISDVILLQKYLLTAETLTAQQAAQADLFEDNCLDIFDLIAIKQLLA
jgi:hypothetical protein